jgi:hypothetical protein
MARGALTASLKLGLASGRNLKGGMRESRGSRGRSPAWVLKAPEGLPVPPQGRPF